MKKFLKIFLPLLAVIVIASTVLRFFAPSIFFGYIYPFSRIRGNVAITIDGKKVSLSDCEVTCTHQQKNEKLHVSGNKIKSRAGQYGRYYYNIIHGNTEIRFYVFQHNCWNCANYDILFDVDTANRTVSCKGYCKALDENGLRETFEINSNHPLEYDQFDDGICILSP